MSKKIDWESQYKQPMRGKVAGPNAKYRSRREQVQQSIDKLTKAQAEQEAFRRLEPHLRKSLLEHMVSRTPIRVIDPMAYFTEELAKSESQDAIDQAYYRRPQQPKITSFEIVQKAIEPGTELTFVKANESMGTWIFKSSTGEEIEIYDKPVITLGPDRVVHNPGFWGLLRNTNIYYDLVNPAEETE